MKLVLEASSTELSSLPVIIARAGELLGLVHSDVCGKVNKKSLGGAEYILTFIDDKLQYV